MPEKVCSVSEPTRPSVRIHLVSSGSAKKREQRTNHPQRDLLRRIPDKEEVAAVNGAVRDLDIGAFSVDAHQVGDVGAVDSVVKQLLGRKG